MTELSTFLGQIPGFITGVIGSTIVIKLLDFKLKRKEKDIEIDEEASKYALHLMPLVKLAVENYRKEISDSYYLHDQEEEIRCQQLSTIKMYLPHKPLLDALATDKLAALDKGLAKSLADHATDIKIVDIRVKSIQEATMYDYDSPYNVARSAKAYYETEGANVMLALALARREMARIHLGPKSWKKSDIIWLSDIEKLYRTVRNKKSIREHLKNFANKLEYKYQILLGRWWRFKREIVRRK